MPWDDARAICGKALILGRHWCQHVMFSRRLNCWFLVKGLILLVHTTLPGILFSIPGRPLLYHSKHHEVLRRETPSPLVPSLPSLTTLWTLFIVHWGLLLLNIGTLMASKKLLQVFCPFFLVLLSCGRSEASQKNPTSDLLCICNRIAATISGASQVFFCSRAQHSLICDTPI
jgi:hypothetical protein